MSAEIKELVHRVAEELWNQKNVSVIDEVCASNLVVHTPQGDLFGPDGYRQLYTMYTTAFPDCLLSIGELVAESNLVAIPYTFSGTHTGELMGIPPTGKHVTVEGTAITCVEDGKIVNERSIWDTLSLMQQLGVVPELEEVVG